VSAASDEDDEIVLEIGDDTRGMEGVVRACLSLYRVKIDVYSGDLSALSATTVYCLATVGQNDSIYGSNNTIAGCY